MAGRGPVKRSNQTEKKTIGIGGPRLGLPTGPAQRAPLNRYEGKQFGQVVSVNAGFGFLQPYGEKEQAYYSQRDAPAGLELGAEVAFLLQRGARGLSASAIQTVSPDAIVTKAAQRGIVAQAAEGLRCPVGHIRVSGSGDETDTSDSFAVYVEGEGGAWRQPLAVGDEVEFTLGIIPETTYKRATNTTLIQMRKDRKKNEKIKALIAAGAEQEQGIVESIVKGGDYGFVKCADRTGQLYFKISDVVGGGDVREGSEVQFLVIEDPGSGKGQQRHRAVHITALPPGTVRFEVTLQQTAQGVVVKDPVFYPKEAPGLIRIVNGDATEGRVGDSLQCDVVRYRPEKLVFARSVRVLSFRRLGRETGTVIKLTRNNGGHFGFIKPDIRDHDVFFRIPDVVAADGSLLPEAEVTVGLRVSFDVIAEDGSRAGGGGGRTRAIRVCVEPSLGKSLLLPEGGRASAAPSPVKAMRPATDADATPERAMITGDPSRCLMRAGVIGVIERMPKKEHSGVIRIVSDISRLAELDFTDVLHKDIINALYEFMALDEWKEVTMEHVGSRTRKTMHTIIKLKFPGVAHETVPNPGENTAGHESSQTVKLWKLGPDEFIQWEAERTLKEKSELTNRLFKLMTKSGVSAAPTELRNGLLPLSEGAVHDYVTNPFYAAFTSADMVPSRWTIEKGSKIIFDLCLDAAKNCLSAAAVILTNEAPEDTAIEAKNGSWIFGRIDSVKHMKGGYIRCFPTDEKLRWEISSVLCVPPRETARHNPAALWNAAASLLLPETLVACQVRVIGGVRMAVGLHAVPVKQMGGAAGSSDETRPEGDRKELEGVAKPLDDSFYANISKKTEMLYGECLAVVVENKHIVLLDVSACPLLVNKYHDITDMAFAHWLSHQLGTADAYRTGANAECWGRGDKKQEIPLEEPSEDAKVAGDDAASDDGEKAPFGSSGTVNYLQRMHTFPIPFYVESKLSSNGGHYAVGDIVVCTVVANWCLQRSPLHANILRKFDFSSESTHATNVVSTAPFSEVVPRYSYTDISLLGAPAEAQNVRRCGTVRKIHTSISLYSSGRHGERLKSNGSGAVEQWAEIVFEIGCAVSASAGGELTSKEVGVFLYDMRGLPRPIATDNLPEQKEASSTTPAARLAAVKQALASLSEGDLVDFIPVVTCFRSALAAPSAAIAPGSVYGAAVAVNVVRTSGLDKGKKLVVGKPTSVPVLNPLITKPRNIVNAELKDGQAKGGIKCISMAEGPLNDVSVGFNPGWRPQIDFSTLPWAHLLTHLPPGGV